MAPKQSKPKDIQKANINGISRAASSEDQGDCTTESHQSPTIEVHTKTQGVRKDQLQKQRETRTVSQTMGRQRNNPQMKGEEEASKRMLNETEASQLSDTEFKAKVIRKLIELTENYQKLQGHYKELTANYINMKRGKETIDKTKRK